MGDMQICQERKSSKESLGKNPFDHCSIEKLLKQYDNVRGHYTHKVKTHKASLPKSNYTPNGRSIQVSYCKSSVLTPFLWEWNMERFCFWYHPTLNRMKRIFCSVPVTNRLKKPGCWFPFPLCVPIQLAVGPQNPETHCCNTSMIIIGAIIRKLPFVLAGWILLFSLRGKRCKVKHHTLDSARFKKKTHHYRIIWNN